MTGRRTVFRSLLPRRSPIASKTGRHRAFHMNELSRVFLFPGIPGPPRLLSLELDGEVDRVPAAQVEKKKSEIKAKLEKPGSGVYA